MSAQEAVSKKNPATGATRRLRIFDMPLGNTALDVEINADVYLRNGFRLLGVPACAGKDDIARQLDRFKVKARMDPKAFKLFCVATGYDDAIVLDDVADQVERLRDVRYRFVWGLFWPHDVGGCFPLIKKRGLTGDIDQLAADLQRSAGRDSTARALADHALAIAYHNQAIASEFRHLSTGGVWKNGTWSRALEYWGKTIEADAFWKYVQAQAVKLDDPRVRVSDVAELRVKLSRFVLEFNAIFARSYCQTSDHHACNAHLNIISAAPFADQSPSDALLATVKSLTSHRLDATTQRVQQELLGIPKALPWREFRAKADPILADATDVLRYLREDVRLVEEIVQTTHFDRVFSGLVDALSKKINYAEDHERALFYGVVITTRLLTFPLSPELRRRIESERRDDLRHLYKDFELPDNVEAWDCWFAPGEAADPEASILLPVFKITKLTPVRIGWSSRKVLVPRSTLAEQVQLGKVKESALADRQRSPAAVALRKQMDDAQHTLDTTLQQLAQQAAEEQTRLAAETAAKLHAFDATSVAEATQAKRLIAEIDGALLEYTKAAQAELAQIKEKLAQKHRRETAQREAEDQKRLRELEKECDAEREAIRASRAQALHEIDDDYTPRTRAADAKLQAVLAAYSGVGGILRADLPIGTGGAVLTALVGYLLNSYFFLPFDLLTGPGLPLAWLAGVVGLASSLIAHRLIQTRIIQNRRGAAAAVREAHRKAQLAVNNDAAEKERCVDQRIVSTKEDITAQADAMARGQREETGLATKNVDVRVAQRQAVAAASRKEWESRLSAVAKRRQTIEAEGASRASAVKSKADAAAQKARTDGEGQIRGLRAKIEGMVQLRKESAKTDYPAYCKAKSQSFEDGEKPSDSDAQRRMSRESDNFMSSLTDMDKIYLQVLQEKLSTQEFNEFLSEVAALPRHQRSARIMSFFGK